MRQFDRRLAYHLTGCSCPDLAVAGVQACHDLQRYSGDDAHRLHDQPARDPSRVRRDRLRRHGGCGFFDYRRLERYAYVIYAFALVLVMVPVMGSVGAARGIGSTSASSRYNRRS